MKKEDGKKSKYASNVKMRRISYFIGSILFLIVLASGTVMALNIKARPSFSDSEKRTLAAFPKFSISALFSGSYFDDISLWYSDTFPSRDKLISVSSTIKKCIGIGDTIYNFSEKKSDEIPEAASESESVAEITTSKTNSEAASALMKKPALDNADTTTSAQKENNDVLEQNLDAIYIYGDTAYEYYNFVKSTADKYIANVNKAADTLTKNKINVYNMIIPTSIDITLNDSSRKKLNSSDQQDAISYMYSKMNDNVKTVSLFQLMKAHKNEYIYYRTDHHWTSLGAYYAYAQYMIEKGGQYTPLSDFTQYEFPGFLGSFYNDTNKNTALTKSPDTVYAYMPKVNTSFKYLAKGANDYVSCAVIVDATDYSPSYKYLCFIAGDNPISVIENKDMESGESCILVKESFGNAFAPYLSCNYKYVYIIDYRYYTGNITEFAKSKGVSDVIIQNNISMTRNASLVDTLGGKF